MNIDQLARKINEGSHDNTIAILTGAGISMLPPTELPSGNQLRDMLVEAICHADIMPDGLWSRIRTNDTYSETIPEVLFQRIWGHLGDDMYSFFDILGYSQPNKLHHLLNVIHYDRGVPVLTTNFDTLIEESRPHGSHLNRPGVLHLHGSLNTKQSIRVRLNHVGRGIDSTVRDKLSRQLDNKSLFVLGYSGRDTDIVRALEERNITDVYWCIIDKNDPAYDSARDSDLGPVHFIEGDLNKLAEQLGNLVLNDDYLRYTNVQYSFNQEVFLSDWASSLDENKAILAIASVLKEVNDFSTATDLVQYGLNNLDNQQNTNNYKTGVSYILLTAGDFERALDVIQQIDFAGIEDSYEKSEGLNTKGLIFLERENPEPKKAITFFHKAKEEMITHIDGDVLKTLDESERRFIAAIHNNIGLSYNLMDEYDQAVSHYKKSIYYKRRIGDIVGLARAYANISITYLKMGKYGVSEKWRERSFRKVSRYGLEFLEMYLLRNTGAVLCDNGFMEDGKDMLDRALNIAKSIEGARYSVKIVEKMIKEHAE